MTSRADISDASARFAHSVLHNSHIQPRISLRRTSPALSTLFLSLSISLYLSLSSLSIHLSIHLSIYLSIYPYIHLSRYSSIYPSTRPPWTGAIRSSPHPQPSQRLRPNQRKRPGEEPIQQARSEDASARPALLVAGASPSAMARCQAVRPVPAFTALNASTTRIPTIAARECIEKRSTA